MWRKGQGAPQTHAQLQTSFQNFNLFMALEDLSIVLRSCPGTALVRMNFGWSVLDSFFSSAVFLSKFLGKISKNEL